MNKLIIKLIFLALLGLCTAFFSGFRENGLPKSVLPNENSGATDLKVFKEAFDNQQSGLRVTQTGRIVKLLRDDDHEPRHQKFIVALSSGQNLMIAHNIDLAPRVDGLATGNAITFSGVYEWNNKGGVVHWTHRDPRGKHENGWLLYNNRKYE